MKIVFLDAATMGSTPMDEISALGELVCYPTSTPQEALLRVSDCEVLIVNKVIVNAALIAAAPRLRLICECATGVNNIDLDAAALRGVPVRNVAGYSTDSVVQATFMHILSLLGSAPYFDSVVKDGHYSRSGMFTDPAFHFTELAGKTVGIIGLGAIGLRVAKVAEAFGAVVIYYSTSGTSHNSDYPSVSLQRLMRDSDIVTIHAPLNDRTRGLIGSEQLAMMKPSAILVNAGRGGIIDEPALAHAIDTERIAGAALDVFEKEPLPADNPLLHTRHPERLRFTPHTAWASAEACERLIHGVAANIRQGW